jgi:hypothetical protein
MHRRDTQDRNAHGTRPACTEQTASKAGVIGADFFRNRRRLCDDRPARGGNRDRNLAVPSV